MGLIKLRTPESYQPYLAADIADTLIVPFDTFLDTVFNISLKEGEQFLTIIKSPRFKSLLSDYAEEVNKETDRYRSFNILANHILVELAKKEHRSQDPSIAFCRNDPISDHGSFATRRPDCVVVYPGALKLEDRFSCDKLSKDGPKENPFHWSELLAF